MPDSGHPSKRRRHHKSESLPTKQRERVKAEVARLREKGPKSYRGRPQRETVPIVSKSTIFEHCNVMHIEIKISSQTSEILETLAEFAVILAGIHDISIQI